MKPSLWLLRGESIMNQREDQLRNQSRRLNEITPTKHGERKPYIFISYKSDDWRDALEDIAYTLHRKYGIRVYYDKSFESSNQNWTEIMKKNIESDMCVAVIVCLTSKYLASYATLLEVLTSQTKEASELDYRSMVKPIVPIVFDDTRFKMHIKKLKINESNKIKENDKLTGIKKIEWDAFQNVMKDITNEKNKVSPIHAKDACEILNSIKDNEDLKIVDVISAFNELEESITGNVNKRQLSTFFTTLYETLCELNDAFMENQKAYMENVIGIIDKSLIKEDFDNVPMTPREDNISSEYISESENKEVMIETVNTFVSEKENEADKEMTTMEEVAELNKIDETVIEAISDTIKDEDSEILVEDTHTLVYFQRAIAEVVDGRYIVKKDSIINKSTTDSCPDAAKRIRKELMECGELVEENNGYRLLTDKEFRSASGAACFVAGHSVSGTVAWKENASFKENTVKKEECGSASVFFEKESFETFFKKHEQIAEERKRQNTSSSPIPFSKITLHLPVDIVNQCDIVKDNWKPLYNAMVEEFYQTTQGEYLKERMLEEMKRGKKNPQVVTKEFFDECTVDGKRYHKLEDGEYYIYNTFGIGALLIRLKNELQTYIDYMNKKNGTNVTMNDVHISYELPEGDFSDLFS